MSLTPGGRHPADLPSRLDSSNSYNYSLLDYYGMDGFSINNPDEVAYDEVSSEEISVPEVLAPEEAGEMEEPEEAVFVEQPVENQPEMHWEPPQIVTDKTKVLASDYDMYGFKKNLNFFDSTKQSYNEWFDPYADQLVNQKKKWLLLMKSNGLAHTGHAPVRFPPKSDKVKKLVRKGIPPEWRGDAWFFYAGGYERLHQNQGIYDSIANDTRNVKNKDTEVIERDLHRTFPDNKYFNPGTAEEAPIISLLRRVLVAFAHYQPQIGYCQSLNFLAGLLLLFMSEERAFWMLVIMTERIIPKVHSANLEGVHTDQGVLMLCVKEYIPRLWQIIGRTLEGLVLSEDKILAKLPPVTLVTLSWFMSVFVGVLPIESVLRIWDILWYEGSKTLFRISLAVCRLCLDNPRFANEEKRDSIQTEQIELFQFMQSYPKTFTDPNLLVDKCFKKIGGYGYGFLSQDEINKCREFVAQQRSKLKNKAVVTAEMSSLERDALQLADDSDIHDVYGFHKSIMNGVVWNKHLSSKMKKKFKKSKRD